MAWRTISSLLIASLAACDEPVRPTSGDLALGTWGGEDAGVIVTESAVHVHVGCTQGDIGSRAVADDEGRFSIEGNYILRAYPVQLGPSLPATFTGRVIGDVLTMTIAVNDTTDDKIVRLGPITVRLGRDPRLGPCPICRMPAVSFRAEGEESLSR